MKTLWTPIDGCFQAHSRIMMTVMMQQYGVILWGNADKTVRT